MKYSPSKLFNKPFTETQLTWITRFLFVSSLFLIIALSYSYDSINKELVYYSEKVNQAERIITGLNDASSLIFRTAYLSNSLLISKDTVYLNKTLAALNSLSEKTKKLDSMLAHNEAHQKRSAAMRLHLDRFRDYTLMLNQSSHLPIDSISAMPAFTDRNSRIDAVLSLIKEMSDMEQKFLHTRIQSRDGYTQKTYRYKWIMMFVAVAFLSSAFILLDREIQSNKRYRIDLENTIENLNRSNSELEQFAYVASHDLQEPLRKIRSFSDRTMSKYASDLPDDAFQMLSKIDDSSRRMQSLIQDLLSFSRIVNKGSKQQIVNLNSTITQARSNLSEMIQEHGGTIHCETLPSITGYVSQMEQLFQNLLSNSIKYHKQGQTPQIQITHSLIDGDQVPKIKPSQVDLQFHLIRVSDNGIGFKQEFAEKIFVIFQRLHDRNKFAGTGIGLAICKRIVSNHNGYIFADSPDGGGANFYIYLPV